MEGGREEGWREVGGMKGGRREGWREGGEGVSSGVLTAHPPCQSSVVKHAFSSGRLPSINVGYDAHIADNRARVESVLFHLQTNSAKVNVTKDTILPTWDWKHG